MSLSAQGCFNRAVSRSSLNSTQLYDINDALGHMSTFEQAAFIMAGAANPDFYSTQGVSIVRSAFGDSWNLDASPGSIGIINLIEIATIEGTVSDIAVGDELTIVDRRVPEAGLFPRAYIQGKLLYGFGTELGAADSDMVTQVRVHYSFIPTPLVSTADLLTLTDQWVHLVSTPMAGVLALSDQREEEYAALTVEHERDVQVYLQHVGSFRHHFQQHLGTAPMGGPNVPQFGGR